MNKMNKTILVVDDTPDTLEVVRRYLEAAGYVVFVSRNVPDAMSVLESQDIDLVITDFRMPRIDGLELLKHIRENYRNLGTIMITGYASIRGAIDAIKEGAEEYLLKPFTESELLDSVQQAIMKLDLRNVAKTDGPLVLKDCDIIGESKAIQDTLRAVKMASSSTATVLINGESGTGKELIARAIHYNSNRPRGAFIAVNCGGIPKDLYESELFGHVKGSFTGATESRAGFFQTADGGSLFLDEISETPLSLQVKLLRVLQEKEIFMVGQSRPQKVDARIIVATNKDLQSLIQSGKFRQDHFYRINVETIDVPPLRSRGNDVILLARYFLEKYSEEMGKPLPDLSDRALKILTDYGWPGNIRELENLIQRCVVMSDRDIIEAVDFPAHMRHSINRNGRVDQSLAEVEMEYITRVVSSLNGNLTKAADILKIDRKTLRTKLKCKVP